MLVALRIGMRGFAIGPRGWLFRSGGGFGGWIWLGRGGRGWMRIW